MKLSRIEKFKDYRKQLQTSLTAKQMFEELGYEEEKNKWEFKTLVYIKRNGVCSDYRNVHRSISFKNNKCVEVIDYFEKKDKYDGLCGVPSLDFNEIKAIYQQYKELGWIESENK